MWRFSTSIQVRILFFKMTMTMNESVWVCACVRFEFFIRIFPCDRRPYINTCQSVLCSMLNVHSLITLLSQIRQLSFAFSFTFIHFQASFLSLFAHTKKMYNEIFLVFFLLLKMINAKLHCNIEQKKLEHIHFCTHVYTTYFHFTAVFCWCCCCYECFAISDQE